MDAFKNFAKSDVSAGYAAGVTSIVLTAGGGAKFPATPFNAVWWDTAYPDPSDDPNVEVVRVTNVTTDTLTITRAQEGTGDANHNTGGHTYRLIAPLTAKTFGELTVPDGAVTLAKLATGTAGNLISYDAAGNPAAIATGTVGQVLTSNGAGAAPTFQAAAGSGANTALSNLASVAINADLATGAGTAANLIATAPAQITTAQAGTAANVTASNAVAGSGTAGAAAGGSVALHAGDAARLTSGNANGGDIDLSDVGAGVGTGTAGQVLLPSGVAVSPALAFAASPSRATGMFWASNYVGFAASGVASFAVGFGSANIGTGSLYSGASISGSDTGLSRAAAGVWRTTAAGGTTSSWLQITPGESRVTTQMDAASNTTLADITGLTSSLIAGRKYRFRATLFVDADAVGGIKFAVAGTATATSIVYQINAIRNDTSVYAITSRQTALGGAAGIAGATAYYVEIVGTIVCNAAGTLRPQFAQNVANGTSSVLVNSTWEVTDIV